MKELRLWRRSLVTPLESVAKDTLFRNPFIIRTSGTLLELRILKDLQGSRFACKSFIFSTYKHLAQLH
jgi:hypothetical protein